MNRDCLLPILQARLPALLAITQGERWWAAAAQASLYEALILSEKTELDTARAGLIADIQQQGTVQADDVLIDKAATIERCVGRAREQYDSDAAGFALSFTRQDAAVLMNIQRACEAALDMGQHLIRRESPGVPQGAHDVFALLARGGWIETALAEGLKRMVGFRNIAVHDDQSLQLPITVSVIERHLGDFLDHSRALLLRDAGTATVSSS